jgi:hypothetical protein
MEDWKNEVMMATAEEDRIMLEMYESFVTRLKGISMTEEERQVPFIRDNMDKMGFIGIMILVHRAYGQLSGQSLLTAKEDSPWIALIQSLLQQQQAPDTHPVQHSRANPVLPTTAKKKQKKQGALSPYQELQILKGENKALQEQVERQKSELLYTQLRCTASKQLARPTDLQLKELRDENAKLQTQLGSHKTELTRARQALASAQKPQPSLQALEKENQRIRSLLEREKGNAMQHHVDMMEERERVKASLHKENKALEGRIAKVEWERVVQSEEHQRALQNLHKVIDTQQKQMENQRADLERARLKATANNKQIATLNKTLKSYQTEKKSECDLQCKICFDSTSDIVYVPCGHVSCESCSGECKNKECPFCRAACRSKVKIFP